MTGVSEIDVRYEEPLRITQKCDAQPMLPVDAIAFDHRFDAGIPYLNDSAGSAHRTNAPIRFAGWLA